MSNKLSCHRHDPAEDFKIQVFPFVHNITALMEKVKQDLFVFLREKKRKKSISMTKDGSSKTSVGFLFFFNLP